MSEKKPSKVLTTGFGIPVGDDQNSLTAGERGPVLMQDVHLLDKLRNDSNIMSRGFVAKNGY